MRRILRYKPAPAMVVASIALAIALGGTGSAAISLPAGSVGTAQLKKNAVNSSKVKDRSLLAKDFKAGQLPRGAKGAKGDTGSQGPQGVQGVQGPEGPFPSSDIPAGKTLRGNWIASGNAAGGSELAFDTVSFGFRLAAAPTAHLLAPAAPPTPECPGSIDAPEAAAGHLCFYTYSSPNVGTRFTCNPINNTCGASLTNRFGTVVRVTSVAAGSYYSWGTWAVTSS